MSTVQATSRENAKLLGLGGLGASRETLAGRRQLELSADRLVKGQGRRVDQQADDLLLGELVGDLLGLSTVERSRQHIWSVNRRERGKLVGGA
mgnify:CR=1 FL=1